MAAGAPFLSSTAAGAPSHSQVVADALSTSGANTLSQLTALRMSNALSFPFSTALPITTPSSSVSVSGSNATTGGQVVVNGTGVNFNFTASDPIQSTSHSEKQKPFVLKLRTKQIRVCQSYRKDYDGANDTLGLVVARAERRLVSNLTTGVQFLGR
jgi:hypothetical protein